MKKSAEPSGYSSVLTDIAYLLESARRASVQTTNAIMTATYWEIGRRIVEYEQRGRNRADYGELLLEYLARDLTKKFGRGFGRENLRLMRLFYSVYKDCRISQTLSGKCDTIRQTLSAEFNESISPDSNGNYPDLNNYPSLTLPNSSRFPGRIMSCSCRYQHPFSITIQIEKLATLYGNR